ncbi:MAG: GNAT family N-acetyltransferase [Burkholderiales bacterium]|nr:GNAT family N-acetyltransferase [Burkholderiales bacterium]
MYRQTTMELHTPQLILRRFTLDDAEAFLPLVSLPEVIRYTGEAPRSTVEEVRELLSARQLRDYAVHGFGRLACIERSTGRLVGFSGLKFLEDMNEIDVGYRFLPDCWGKGYATESARAAMQYEVAQHGIRRVIGLVEPANGGSVHVLSKLGLTFEKHLSLPDYPEDIDLYAAAMPIAAAGSKNT